MGDPFIMEMTVLIVSFWAFIVVWLLNLIFFAVYLKVKITFRTFVFFSFLSMATAFSMGIFTLFYNWAYSKVFADDIYIYHGIYENHQAPLIAPYIILLNDKADPGEWYILPWPCYHQSEKLVKPERRLDELQRDFENIFEIGVVGPIIIGRSRTARCAHRTADEEWPPHDSGCPQTFFLIDTRGNDCEVFPELRAMEARFITLLKMPMPKLLTPVQYFNFYWSQHPDWVAKFCIVYPYYLGDLLIFLLISEIVHLFYRLRAWQKARAVRPSDPGVS